METALSTYRFSVAEFNKLGAAGIFDENDRVELLDGEIIIMSPIGREHAGVVMRLNAVLSGRLGRRALVNPQNPAVIDEFSELLPDFTLLRPKKDFYKSGHPQPDDIFLVIEVSDPTLTYDRGPKLQKYAERGINEVWIVNVSKSSIEQFREPTPRGFQSSKEFRPGDRIEIASFPEISFGVEELIG